MPSTFLYADTGVPISRRPIKERKKRVAYSWNRFTTGTVATRKGSPQAHHRTDLSDGNPKEAPHESSPTPEITSLAA